METSELPLILLPGMNGDPRVFAKQVAAFPNLIVPRWIPPLGDEEPLADYAQRLAAKIDPGRPCLIGGVSFGGIVALEVAKHLQARGCVLIASCRGIEGLPPAIRLVRPVTALVPSSLIARVARWGQASAASIEPAHVREFAKLMPRDQAFRRWAVQVLLKWQPELPDCPLHQIHGERDSTFNAGNCGADCIVPEAGHLLTLTHADMVNEYLQGVVTSCRGQCG